MKYALVCVLLLNVVLAETRIHDVLQKTLRKKRQMQGLRQLSGYGAYLPPVQQSYNKPAQPSAPAYRAPAAQAPSYRAPAAPAPAAQAYQAPVAQAYQAPVAQTYRAPAAQAQTYRAPAVQAPAYEAPAPSYETPVQQSYEEPAPSYEEPAQSYQAPVQQSYQAPAAPAPTYQAPAQSYQAPVQQSYAQAPAMQQQQQSYGVSPLQSYYNSAPAIQQLIQYAVNQHQGGLNAGYQSELQNTCSLGFTQPILEAGQVSETYCRCPSGTYGFTCAENFINPCADGVTQYAPADSRIPSNYFIQCSWGLPYLQKCAPGTDMWSQDLLTCVQLPTEPVVSSQSNYGGSSYGNVGY